MRILKAVIYELLLYMLTVKRIPNLQLILEVLRYARAMDDLYDAQASIEEERLLWTGTDYSPGGMEKNDVLG